MTKSFKLEKCLKENGWTVGQITQIQVNGESFKQGTPGFSSRLRYLNSGKMTDVGISVGFPISAYGCYSTLLKIWSKKKIYQLYRKSA